MNDLENQMVIGDYYEDFGEEEEDDVLDTGLELLRTVYGSLTSDVMLYRHCVMKEISRLADERCVSDEALKRFNDRMQYIISQEKDGVD